MLFIGHFDIVLVMVVFDVVQEAGSTKRESILLRKGWIEGFPQRRKASDRRHVKKSGCQHPTRQLNVLVEPSQKYRDANNMQGLTRWAYLDT